MQVKTSLRLNCVKLSVTSPEFTGKSMLASQRLVYGAIAHLMSGDRAPIHAVDTLTTKTA